ncbi:MAG: hypothetical protein PHR30_18755 [Gallionellaceae bacterium]|nr:hypothetical protein [Gallionellaceae bacterium]
MKRFGIIWACVCLLAICAGGCSEAQRETVDRWAPTAQQVGQAAGDFAGSESGQTLLGPDVSFWGSLSGLSLAAIAAIWQTVRRDKAVQTLSTVVKAVDKVNDAAKEEVKALVTVDAAGAALIETAKRA